VILHGSRSGQRHSIKREFDGTRNYAASKPPIYENGVIVGYLGWQATIGEDEYSVHMTARQWGWHAGGDSYFLLGTELAQANEGDAITDGQVRAWVAWYRAEVVPVWGEIVSGPQHLSMHGERPQGRSIGKSDAFRAGDPRADQLRARILAAL
jgi:hypothetical protein